MFTQRPVRDRARQIDVLQKAFESVSCSCEGSFINGSQVLAMFCSTTTLVSRVVSHPCPYGAVNVTLLLTILGQIVVGPDGKDIARLVDMLVDGNGQPVQRRSG